MRYAWGGAGPLCWPTVSTLPLSRTSPTFTKIFFPDIVHGRALVFDLRCVADILGLRFSPMTVVLKPIPYHLRSHVCSRGRPV